MDTDTLDAAGRSRRSAAVVVPRCPDRVHRPRRRALPRIKATSDLLCGLGGADVLTGSAGRDRIFGQAGNDRIRARDWGFDVIGCGDGLDVVFADRVDLVGVDCERVSRPTERDR